jgi:hypothetical protein
LIYVAGIYVGAAILMWFCNTLLFGCESASILQRIWFGACNSCLRSKRVIPTATEKIDHCNTGGSQSGI